MKRLALGLLIVFAAVGLLAIGFVGSVALLPRQAVSAPQPASVPTPDVEATVRIAVSATGIARSIPIDATATAQARPALAIRTAPVATSVPLATPTPAKSSIVLQLEQREGMTIEQAVLVDQTCATINPMYMTKDIIDKCSRAKALIGTIHQMGQDALFQSIPPVTSP